MKNKVRPTSATLSTQRHVDSHARRLALAQRPATAQPQLSEESERQVDELAAHFFSQDSLFPVAVDREDDYRAARRPRGAMYATFAMLFVSGGGLIAFLIYSRLIMPVPEELSEGLVDLQVPAAAALPLPEAPRAHEWHAQLYDPSAPPDPVAQTSEATPEDPEAASGALPPTAASVSPVEYAHEASPASAALPVAPDQAASASAIPLPASAPAGEAKASDPWHANSEAARPNAPDDVTHPGTATNPAGQPIAYSAPAAVPSQPDPYPAQPSAALDPAPAVAATAQPSAAFDPARSAAASQPVAAPDAARANAAAKAGPADQAAAKSLAARNDEAGGARKRTAAAASSVGNSQLTQALPNSDLVKQAYGSLNRGDATGALALARRAVVETPARADAWIALGSAYDAINDRESARDAFRNCLARANGPFINQCRDLARD